MAKEPTIGVLSLQGAFAEHQEIMESLGCKTIQIKKPSQLDLIDGLILPGGESTAMGLIGSGELWSKLQNFVKSKPVWGTCAGLILLCDSCVGASAVITNGQSLIGGLSGVLVCRNYFGSQISSFEMATPPPPGFQEDYPGVFIRAPAILTVGSDVTILGKVTATPCRQAAVVLKELDEKIAKGEKVVMMKVVDALKRDEDNHIIHGSAIPMSSTDQNDQEEKKDVEEFKIVLPGAAEGSNAREVICAIRKENILGTAFHPELTQDSRWHEYFRNMVMEFQ